MSIRAMFVGNSPARAAVPAAQKPPAELANLGGDEAEAAQAAASAAQRPAVPPTAEKPPKGKPQPR